MKIQMVDTHSQYLKIKSEIDKNEALLADGNLSEGTKSLIQKQIDTGKEKLSQIKLPEPSYKINGQDVSEEVFLSNLSCV